MWDNWELVKNEKKKCLDKQRMKKKKKMERWKKKRIEVTGIDKLR